MLKKADVAVYDTIRDLLAGVRDYHQAQVANDQNEVMKRLTVIASVLLVPTFIVGLYGQNLRVAFVSRLRGEKRFPSVEDLVAQMHTDVADAREICARYDGRGAK